MIGGGGSSVEETSHLAAQWRIVPERLRHSLQMVPEAAGLVSGFRFEGLQIQWARDHLIQAAMDEVWAAAQQPVEALHVVRALQWRAIAAVQILGLLDRKPMTLVQFPVRDDAINIRDGFRSELQTMVHTGTFDYRSLMYVFPGSAAKYRYRREDFINVVTWENIQNREGFFFLTVPGDSKHGAVWQVAASGLAPVSAAGIASIVAVDGGVFALGLSTLTVPPIALTLIGGQVGVSLFFAALGILLVRGLRDPRVAGWLDQA